MTTLDDTISAAVWEGDTPPAWLAWSQAEPPPVAPYIGPPPWRRAVMRVAAAAIAVGSGVAATALLLLAADQPGASAASVAPTTPAVAAPAAAPTPFVVPPIADVALQTADGEYLALLRRAGIGVDKVPRDAVVANGHRTCQNFAATGWPVSQVVARSALEFPQLTRAQVQGFVMAAVQAYCPQFG